MKNYSVITKDSIGDISVYFLRGTWDAEEAIIEHMRRTFPSFRRYDLEKIIYLGEEFGMLSVQMLSPGDIAMSVRNI